MKLHGICGVRELFHCMLRLLTSFPVERRNSYTYLIMLPCTVCSSETKPSTTCRTRLLREKIQSDHLGLRPDGIPQRESLNVWPMPREYLRYDHILIYS